MRLPSRLRRPLAAFGLGLLSATGYAPLDAWPLTIAAFAGLLWLVERAGGLRAALATGWWFGSGSFVLGLSWIATAFTYQSAMPAWLGWIAVVLLSLYLSVYPAVAAGLAWRWGRVSRTVMALVLAAAWIVTEWLRATVFTGFAWNPVGVAVVDLSVAQVAPWVGTYGLSGLVVLAGGALLAILRLPGRQKAIALPFLLLIAIDLKPALPPADGPLIQIAQPNISQAEKWEPGFEARNWQRLQTVSGTPGTRPRLLLWPEAAVPDYLEEEPMARRRLSSLLGPDDLLLTGGTALIFDDAGDALVAAHNSMFALTPDARIVARYDKSHLTPYGEYLPMRPVLSALGLSRLAPGDLDFWPGPGAQTLDLGRFGKVGLQICYEIIFSGHVVERGDRPAFIFNPSNDAWFGPSGPPQHLAQARLRAIEEGLPVVRSTPTGISAVIDASGTLVETVPAGVPGVILTRVPAARPPTPFSRVGNLLPFLLAGVFVGLAVVTSRRAG